MGTVNVCYTTDSRGIDGMPLKVFGNAYDAAAWCEYQNDHRSLLEVSKGITYVYSTFVVE